MYDIVNVFTKGVNMTLEDLDIQQLSKIMEEMARLPRETEIKRQPGEKCSYEIYSNLSGS
jgi:hypothetical protein